MIGHVACNTFDPDAIGDIQSPSSVSFNNTVVKLAARLIFTRPQSYDIHTNFIGYLQNPVSLKIERFLVHWLLPLCIRMGTGRLGKKFVG